jgi:hypothetical protein
MYLFLTDLIDYWMMGMRGIEAKMRDYIYVYIYIYKYIYIYMYIHMYNYTIILPILDGDDGDRGEDAGL